MTKEKKTEHSRLELGALCVWAAVLIVAFLANRGSDVGQIGKLFENLGGGPLLGNGVVESFFGIAIALTIAGAWLGVGHFAVSFLKITKSEHHSHILELGMKTTVGASICSLTWFFLGVAGAYNGTTAIVVTLVGLASAAFGLAGRDESQN